MSKYHLSRSQRGAWAADNPIGDPFGGPAYGEKLDVGGIVGGLVGGNSADKAADAQARAGEQANALSQRQYEETRNANQPFVQAGQTGVNQLAYLLGLGGYNANNPNSLTGQLINMSRGAPTYNPYLYANNDAYRTAWDDLLAKHQAKYGSGYTDRTQVTSLENDLRNALSGQINQERANDPLYGSLNRKFSQEDLESDPIYKSTMQFAIDQGTQGVNRQAAATGNMLSGATLKALSRFGANTAATYGNDAFNRYNVNQTNQYNRLAGIAGSGQQAINQVASAGANNAQTQGNNLIGMGNVRGASAIAEGKAYGGVGNILGNAFGKSSIGKSALSIFGL